LTIEFRQATQEAAMTPENIAGFTIPAAQLQELIDALAATAEPPALESELELPEAA
jgi:hypothetical protein